MIMFYILVSGYPGHIENNGIFIYKELHDIDIDLNILIETDNHNQELSVG